MKSQRLALTPLTSRHLPLIPVVFSILFLSLFIQYSVEILYFRHYLRRHRGVCTKNESQPINNLFKAGSG